jgi:predicted RNA-binding Zn-ribbon protein involved in translation (DUF1610 family)
VLLDENNKYNPKKYSIGDAKRGEPKQELLEVEKTSNRKNEQKKGKTGETIILGQITNIEVETGNPEKYGKKRGKITVQSGENWQTLNFEGYTPNLEGLNGHIAMLKLTEKNNKKTVKEVETLDTQEKYLILNWNWKQILETWIQYYTLSWLGIIMLIIATIPLQASPPTTIPILAGCIIGSALASIPLALYVERSKMRRECYKKPEPIETPAEEKRADREEEENKEQDSICPICHMKIGKEEKAWECPNCKQKFHRKHMEEWVKVHRTCPSCGEKIETHRRRFNKLHNEPWLIHVGFHDGCGMHMHHEIWD